jgi:DNA polymerase-3 subunit delta'
MNNQAVLLLSKDKIFIDNYIQTLANKLKISEFENIVINPKISIGIDQVREISKIMSIKPNLSDNRLFIILDFDKATIEAQNALLKVLEEPNIHNYFLLVTNNIETVIPTIKSRCVLKIDKTINYFDDYKSEENGKIFLEIINSNDADKIKFVTAKFKTKQEAEKFLMEMSIFISKMLEQQNFDDMKNKKNFAKILNNIQKASQLLKNNINLKLVMDNLFLSFPKFN